MDASIDLNLSEDILQILVNNAKEYATSNGIIMGSKNYEQDMVTFSPFCLFPSSFSKMWFDYAKEIQPILNKLIHKIAHDYDFLKNCLKRTIEGDDFTKNLFEIYEFLHKEGFVQDISLGLLRADYMLDTDGSGKVSGLKQVEINTIASSFGGLTNRLHSLHTYILRQLNVDLSKFPLPNTATQLALGMVHAWEYYGEKKASILFLVEDTTYNFSDQRILEYAILDINPEIKIVRATFNDMETQGTLKDQKLFLADKEISVVYFRTGYVPDQYKSEKTWEARKMIEMSKAIKCPSIHYHLAGTKKVQQELFQPNVLERFLEDPSEISKVRAVFAEQYSLDLNANGDIACQMALVEPEKFVVKPQREGGGNNVYGADIVNLLEKIGNSKEREGYILMKLIKPPATPNYILRLKDNITLSNVIGELGIFGVIIGNSTKVHENFEAGHMLRSKIQGINEGGVAAGYGCLDLPYLNIS